jgi:putative RecB family exonuclease
VKKSAVSVIQTEPVEADKRPQYLSPSSISTFQQCPLRYRYSRIDRLPEPSTAAQVLGSITHEVLEFLMALPAEERVLQRARTILLDQWEAKWKDDAVVVALSDYERHEFRWNVWNCVGNYFQLEDPREVNLDGIECRLEAFIEDVPILGILDRWNYTPDGTVVISDYKTGKVSRPPYDAEKRQQLMVYVELHETLFDSTVSSAELIYLKSSGKRVAYEPTTEARDGMRTAVSSVWAGMQASCETGEFEARKTRLCDWCSFKSQCPAWRRY